MINRIEKEILVNFFGDTLCKLIYHQNYETTIAETTLAIYFITAHPSFMRLRVIRRINRVHWISKWKISCKDSVVSPYLNLLADLKQVQCIDGICLLLIFIDLCKDIIQGSPYIKSLIWDRQICVHGLYYYNQ